MDWPIGWASPVLADNSRAVAAYRRCGFNVEGRFRDTLFCDGAWHDDLSMAILEPQWAAQQPSLRGPAARDRAPAHRIAPL